MYMHYIIKYQLLSLSIILMFLLYSDQINPTLVTIRNFFQKQVLDYIFSRQIFRIGLFSSCCDVFTFIMWLTREKTVFIEVCWQNWTWSAVTGWKAIFYGPTEGRTAETTSEGLLASDLIHKMPSVYEPCKNTIRQLSKGNTFSLTASCVSVMDMAVWNNTAARGGHWKRAVDWSILSPLVSALWRWTPASVC